MEDTLIFDIKGYEENLQTTIEIPQFPKKWNIGIIYGPSGSGKSTILKKKFPDADEMQKTNIDRESKPKDILAEDILLAVGLKSLPSWHTKIKNLSGGEYERFSIGCLLQSSGDIVILDEFTSLVDRATAKGMSKGISKWCLKKGKKLIVATIHDDFFPYMNSSWIWSTRLLEFLPIPEKEEIILDYEKGNRKYWEIFKKYHYLSGNLSPACNIYLAYNDTILVGMIAFTGHIGGGKRVHRLVVFPEWQGLGLGPKILEETSKKEFISISNIYIKTSHPSMGKYLESSEKWKPTSHNLEKCKNGKKDSGSGKSEKLGWERSKNLCWCYKFTGGIEGGEDQETVIKEVKEVEENLEKGCLKYYGKIVKTGGKYKYLSKRYPVAYFDTMEEAIEARYSRSVERKNDYYVIEDDRIIVRDLFSVNKKYLDILKGHRWHIRNGRVYKSEGGKRVYLSSLIDDEIKLM